MYEALFKQNCDRSWITATTLVAGVDIVLCSLS